MDDKQKLAELATEWRSSGNIAKSVMKSVTTAYELGKASGHAEGFREGMKRAAEIALRERNAEPGNHGMAIGERGFAAQRIIDAILSEIDK